jgi:hypothetical protein
LAANSSGGGIGLLDLGQHRLHQVMLFQGLIVELPIVLLLGGLAKRGVEDVFLDLGVDGELVFDGSEELLALARRPGRRVLQLP